MGVPVFNMVYLLILSHPLRVAEIATTFRSSKSDKDARGYPVITTWRNASCNGAYCSYNPHGTCV